MNIEECSEVKQEILETVNEHVSWDSPLSLCGENPEGRLSVKQTNSLEQKQKRISRSSRCQGKSRRTSSVQKTVSRDPDDVCDLVCSVCQKQFTRVSDLKKHAKTHGRVRKLETSNGRHSVKISHGASKTNDVKPVTSRGSRVKKKFACTQCEKRFARIQRLRVHENVHHSGENPPFQCVECDRRFCDPSSMKRHTAIVHSTDCPRRVFSCGQCGKEFNQRTDLRVHVQRHAGEYSHQCSHCGRCFAKRRDYETHIGEEHAAERPHACDKCGKRFAVLGKLKQHERRHAELDDRFKPYSCYECDKKFSTASSLRAHLQRHSVQLASFSCVICDRTFINRRSLIMHAKFHGVGDEPKRPQCPVSGVQCPVCGKRTNGLSRHLMTHSSVKPYACSSCGKRFRQLWYLESHMRLHTGDLPYACEDCGMCFHTGRYLKRHRFREHQSSLDPDQTSPMFAPIECTICSKRFSAANPYSLKRHVMAVHEDIKPHACDRCGRTFSQLVNLESHLRVHTGERPYECNSCGRRFTQMSNMKLHIRRHHGSAAAST